MYAASRTLMALASEGKAPAVFMQTTKHGVPLASLFLSTAFGAVAFLGTLVGNGEVFYWMFQICGISGLVTWICICIIHIRFRQAYVAQGYDVAQLPYHSPFFPYGQYLAIFMGLTIFVGLGVIAAYFTEPFNWKDVIAVYCRCLCLWCFELCCLYSLVCSNKLKHRSVGLPVYVILYVGYKVAKGTKLVPLLECDFTSDNCFGSVGIPRVVDAPEITLAPGAKADFRHKQGVYEIVEEDAKFMGASTAVDYKHLG
jgi:lysine-specific permease